MTFFREQLAQLHGGMAKGVKMKKKKKSSSSRGTAREGLRSLEIMGERKPPREDI